MRRSLQGMALQYLFIGYANSLSDLSPLEGMPLISLHLPHCSSVSDLSPLHGMPLTTLEVHGYPENSLADLSPLEGLNLTSIILGRNQSVLHNRNSMKVLREMTTLKTIRLRKESYSSGDFWQRFDAGEFMK